MNDSKSSPGDWQNNNKRNTTRLALWTASWLVTMAIASFAPTLLWNPNDALTAMAIGLNLAVGFGMILANKNHLQGLDEMQQRIQLEAMGITLGVGLVVGLAYSNLDVSNLIAFDAEISHLVILMGLTYLAAIVIGTRKYR